MTIDNFNFAGKKAIVRVDFNVPLDENGNITKVIEEKPLGPGLQKVQVTNPLYNTQFPFKSLSENFTVTDNLAIEFSLFENLRFNAEASLTKGTSRSEDFRSMNHTMFANEEDLTKKGSYSKNLGNSFSWSTNASVNYNLTKRQASGQHVRPLGNRPKPQRRHVLFGKGFPERQHDRLPVRL